MLNGGRPPRRDPPEKSETFRDPPEMSETLRKRRAGLYALHAHADQRARWSRSNTTLECPCCVLESSESPRASDVSIFESSNMAAEDGAGVEVLRSAVIRAVLDENRNDVNLNPTLKDATSPSLPTSAS